MCFTNLAFNHLPSRVVIVSSFAFCSRVPTIKLSDILALSGNIDRPYVIVERCPISAWCFVGLHHQNGNMNDMELRAYEGLTHALAWEPDVFVHLRARPETCYARCNARAREGEESIPLSYLRSLDVQYDHLFRYLRERSCPVITLDVEGPPDEIERAFVRDVHCRLATVGALSAELPLVPQIPRGSVSMAKSGSFATDPLKTGTSVKVSAEMMEAGCASENECPLLPHHAIGPEYTKELVTRLCSRLPASQ